MVHDCEEAEQWVSTLLFLKEDGLHSGKNSPQKANNSADTEESTSKWGSQEWSSNLYMHVALTIFILVS